MSDPFNTGDLLPGDILLYRAADGIRHSHSAMIRWLDGTEVSHAGLYMGDGTIAEALAVGENAGLNTQPVVDSVKGCKWVTAHRMKQSPGTMAPVLVVARMYLDQDNRYAYEQILLLAGICLTRKLDCGNHCQGGRELGSAAVDRRTDHGQGLP